ncbi:glycohydrolase toxin TNT-related protein [Mycolicibacterium phocaicum]|uniref:glycohydrolase toxin TNT-related protein n=1 Tax=Mycolicibacterium phocaicum TaxID=319706 RepID=UPI001CFA3FC0|nr:glycohydrolase toxin TNT-related protein [Mycolicibacterium phocaicum]UCZ61917.1 glycohydrolase toxin TNT-related protein [Mycolicibacterium phocaicum]
MTSPITVDPTALNSTGASVGAESNAVTSAISTLTAALSGHESGFGHDAAALVFSRSYNNAALALLHSAASAVNASRRTGQGIQMSAYNYGTANAHSTVGGGESPVPKPGDPGKYSAPAVPSVFGGAVAAPLGWTLVEAFVGGLWPDGDPAQMRATAAAWRTFGSSISGGSGAMTAAGTTLGGFQIPEAPQMQKAANDIGGGLTNIDTQAQALAGQIDSFATTVENAQNAIRDLLHQLSPSGILSTIGGMFEGHNPLDKIKQIAHDIDTVLNNMKREANAMDQAVSQGINDLDGLTTKLENWANKEFVEVFGPEVGGVLAMNFTALADLEEGGFKFVAQTAQGLDQLSPDRFLYDPEGAAEAWEGTAKTLGEMALVGNPLTASFALADPDIRKDLTNLGKSMFDVEDFKNGHPLRAVGFNAAQLGTLAIPGVGEAAPAADAAGGAARVGAAEARAGGTVARDAGAVASRGGAAAAAADEVATRAGNITKSLDTVGVPEAAPGPTAAGKAPVEPPVAAPKPEAAPVPKVESAPSPAPTHEPPAPHTPPPSEPHTPAPVEPGPVEHGNPSGHQPGAPSESSHPAVGPNENHPSPPEPSHNPPPATPPPPVAGHDYGFPPDSAFEHVRNPADDIARLHEGGVPSTVTEGYDPLAGRTEAEFKNEFTTVDGKGRLQWDWDGQAPNNGFDGPPSVSDHIPAGHQLDRLGSNGGGFMGDEGAPLSTRSMPPGVANDYHTFVGTGRPIPDGLNWRVEYGPAKAAFGQPGGAEQWAVINLDTGRPVSVEELKLWRLIRETTGE